MAVAARIKARPAKPTSRGRVVPGLQRFGALSAAVLVGCLLTVRDGQAGSGRLEGKISPPEKVKRVVVLDREVRVGLTSRTVPLKEYPAEFDPQTGAYRVANLPKGTYDLFLELTDGTKVEGCDFRPWGHSDRELSEEDRRQIADHFLKMKSFYDGQRILACAGNGTHARLLIEYIRTGQTSYQRQDKRPFLIWRVENWRYEKVIGGWLKQTEGTRVLRRYLVPVEEWKSWKWYFEPALGGIDLDGNTRTVNYAVPQVPPVERGLFPQELAEHYRRLQAGKLVFWGKVAHYDPETNALLLDVGKRQGVLKGATMTLYRQGKNVGEARITRVEADYSKANLVSGEAQAGDVAELPLPAAEPDK